MFLTKAICQTRLETMVLDIFNIKTGNYERVRVFFDRGSNISVVTKNCAQRCGLGIQGVDNMFISSFGNAARKMNVKRTKLDFFEDTENMKGHLPVDAYIMDTVINDVVSYELSERQRNFLKFQNMELADADASVDGKLKIDILIGQNSVHQFTNQASIFMPGGSVLLPTWGKKFILAGPLDELGKPSNISQLPAPHFLAVHAVLSEFGGLKNLELSKRWVKNINNVYSCISNPEELEIIDTFRNFELLGISPADYEIDPVLEEFNKNAEFDGTRYIVRLPFKEPQIKKLSNNFLQAFQRLMSGHKRRLKEKFADEKEKYEQSFKDELDRGILEKVETLGTMEEINAKLAKNPQYFNQLTLSNGRPCCYLPHQAVYKASTGKFRRVHDGAARPYTSADSINDCLEPGPNLMANILHILLGFRKNKWAAKADIEKAFPQVGIHVDDRDVLRCLWTEGDKIVVYRFKRLPFGLSCSPFILQATLRKHLGDREVDEQTMQNFVASLYVDDSVWSEKFLNDLYKRKELYTEIFAECGMNFRDWTSNHPEARALFAKLENREEKLEELVLGLKWGVCSDELKVNATRLKELVNKKLKTKRDLWRMVPSIYDPIGLVSPFVLVGKMIVAEACKEVKSWDGKLPQRFIDLTLNWASDFDKIENVVWNRFAGIENPKRVQLYGCCDASTKALGACVYLISTAQDDTIHSHLLISKTRNAPVVEHTIPRLELTSAVLLSNIMGHILSVYKKDNPDITWFTDSADVIFWLYSGHFSWKPYVANQLKKLKKKSEVTDWLHLDGKENPADLASRGAPISELIKNKFWAEGPDFWKTGDLSLGKSKLAGYDKHYKDLEMSALCSKELNSSLKKQLSGNLEETFTVSSLMVQVNQVTCGEDNVLQPSREPKIVLPRVDILFDFTKILGSVSYDNVMAYTEKLLEAIDKMSVSLNRNRKLVSEDVASEKLAYFSSRAELLWIQSIQKKYFSELFLLVENSKAKVSAFSRRVFVSHCIFLDKEMKVLRCTTRNEKALLDYSSIYPILLPSMAKNSEGNWENCAFTELLVKKIHERIDHEGVPHTLADLRSEFWVLRGRRFVQKVLSKCFKCKKVQGSPYSVPPSSSLPEFRVIRNKPFAGTGVDYLGPFNLRETPKGKVYKGWLLSFTCGSTRAVHIEAVKTRNIGDFLNALSRFLSFHGVPEAFVSDHEGSFKRTSEELEQIVKSRRVQKYLKTRRICWHFYTEKAPHKGGFLERLNAIIKNAFYKSLKTKVMSFEDFRTLAAHVHSTINDRPLTYVYSDIDSEVKVLTPSMLLRGYNLGEPPHLNLRKPQDHTETKVSETYLKLEKIKDSFWNMWNKQYLSELYERHVRQKKANNELVVPKVGDVCLLSEDKQPRRNWRLARVVGINEKRGVVREVTVQTLSKKKGLITKLNRTPEKLVPLGVSPHNIVPLEMEGEKIEVACEKVIPLEGNELPRSQVKKYTKVQLAKFKRAKLYPPYKKSAQFKDPSSINTGEDSDFVNSQRHKDGKKVQFDIQRHW